VARVVVGTTNCWYTISIRWYEVRMNIDAVLFTEQTRRLHGSKNFKICSIPYYYLLARVKSNSLLWSKETETNWRRLSTILLLNCLLDTSYIAREYLRCHAKQKQRFAIGIKHLLVLPWPSHFVRILRTSGFLFIRTLFCFSEIYST
jgi:hypothetical protein